jgi:hypothetical protein
VYTDSLLDLPTITSSITVPVFYATSLAPGRPLLWRRGGAAGSCGCPRPRRSDRQAGQGHGVGWRRGRNADGAAPQPREARAARRAALRPRPRPPALDAAAAVAVATAQRRDLRAGRRGVDADGALDICGRWHGCCTTGLARHGPRRMSDWC